MSIQFRTIGFPTGLFVPASGSFRLETRQVTSGSVLSNFVMVGRRVQRWRCKLDMVDMDEESAQRWEAFFDTLEGQATLFIMRAPVGTLPLGEGAGFRPSNPSLTITGTSISGIAIKTGGVSARIAKAAPRHATSVLMDGLIPSTRVFVKGDKFGLGGNLYRVAGDVCSDAEGVARVPFRPRLWKPAALGEIVNLRDPTCRMQLVTPNEGAAEWRPGVFASAGYEAVEVPFI